jgi:lysophospholipase L1-like esterase
MAQRIVGAPPAGLTDAVSKGYVDLRALVPTATKTANYTAVAGDFVMVDPTSSAITVTAPALAAGARWGVRLVTASANVVTASTSSGVFDTSGASTLPISSGYALMDVTWVANASATQWVAVSVSKPNNYLGSLFDALGAGAAVQSTDIRRTLRGKQFVGGMYNVGRPNLQATTGTSRAGYKVLIPVTDLRMTFANACQNGTQASPNYSDFDSTASAVVSASWEIGGVLYPITVGGRLSWSVDGGGIVQTDPLPLELAVGALIYLRTFVSGSWYATRYTIINAGGGGWVVTSNLTTPGSAAVADSGSSALFMPVAITGTPLDTAATVPVVLIVGDSIAEGYGEGGYTSSRLSINVGDPNRGGGGYLVRALQAANIPSFNAAFAGDQATTFILPAGRFRRMAFASDASTMICEFGRNDISGGKTLAVIQAALITIWQLRSRQSTRVFQTTITPLTTSTDGWWTTTSQTSSGNDSVRVALNGWIRAGAPMSAGIAVAVGTGGALLAGQVGHPLYSYIEATDSVETARDSGIWKAPVNSRSVADAVTTAAGYSVTSATAAFTQADVGRKIRIVGAGTAGVDYFGTISSVSGSAISLTSPTPTAVNPATIYLADSNTADGIHPGTALHIVIGAAVNTTAFI